MNEQISPIKTNLADEIDQILSSFPEQGLDNLHDLLLMLQEYLQESDQPSELIAYQQQYQKTLATIRQYQSCAPDPDIAERLLKEFKQLPVAAELDEEDYTSLFEALMLDEANNLESALDLATQCEIYLENAEALELSGLQDILYLMLEAVANPQHSDSEQVTAAIDSTLQQYLPPHNNPESIPVLLDLLNQLLAENSLEADDRALLEQALREELNNSEDSSPSVQTHLPETQVTKWREFSPDLSLAPESLKDYISLLSQSYQPLKQSLQQTVEALETENSTQLNHCQETLLERLERFALISQTAEFFGLHLTLNHLQQNINHLSLLSTAQYSDLAELLSQWHFALQHYFQSPTDNKVINELISLHCSPLWPQTISELNAEQMLTALRRLIEDTEENEADTDLIAPSEEDVCLTLPDDVAEELIESLLHELPEQTATFSAAIEKLHSGGGLEDIIIAQRSAHTLKGAGNTVGVKGIANITHYLEDILTALANEECLPNQTILQTLQQAADSLEEISETLSGQRDKPDNLLAVLADILQLSKQIKQQGISSFIAQHSAAPQTTEVQTEKTDAQTQTATEQSEQMLRLPVSMIDKLLQFSNELLINNGLLREKLKESAKQSRSLQKHLDQFQHIGEQMLDLVDKQTFQQRQAQVSADVYKFDSLEMDQYNELYSASRRIHEMTVDAREMNRHFASELREIDGLVIEQGYLNEITQHELQSIRTIPARNIISRLQRGVRQAARMTGKPVNLTITGEDTQFDRDIVNGLLDPLMHILRNAVDHGIEDESIRAEQGKSETGQIELSFRKQQNSIVVDIQDDGAGLNYPAIQDKAIKLGMIGGNESLSEEELKILIMQPNFSTQSTVSHISGRGVGMDAVNSGIKALGGAMQLESKSGEGCHFSIQLPTSLAHYQAILVRLGDQVLAVSELGFEQILLPESGALIQENEQEYFEFENKRYKVITLASLLTRVQVNPDLNTRKQTLLLLNHQHEHYAIAVDKVLSVKELVIKDLSASLPNIHGIIGASLLHDGSIAPLLDMHELLQQPAHRHGLKAGELESQQNPLPFALVVDDSLSARRSLEQFFSDMGYQIMAARDGLDAIEQLEKRQPHIIITDLEMPRVNGLELTEHIRRQPETQNTPVIMITSRATAKHKQLAEEKGVDAYLTKPFSEEELSEKVMQLLQKD